MGSRVCRHPMLRGGPPVTEGLSPRMRSYSRMFTLVKETVRCNPNLEVELLLLLELEGDSVE
jgi:hypothetical protein